MPQNRVLVVRMVAFPQATTVHPETITRYSKGEGLVAPPRLRIVRDSPDTQCHTLKVHPDVWAEALRLADGDAHRIEVHSAESVTVHN